MKKFLTTISFVALQVLCFTAVTSSAHADQIFSEDDHVFLRCDKAADCQKMCQADSCEIAKMTCASCARSSDQAMIAIFRSFETIYQKTEKVVAPASLYKWVQENAGQTLAIAVDSPLNIFSDPFAPEEIERLQTSFNQVCGTPGRHIVLARVASSIEPKAILCETKENSWSTFPVKFHAEYYKQHPHSNLESPDSTVQAPKLSRP